VSESAITTQTDVMAITAFNSADTVRRLSIEVPPNSHCKVREDARQHRQTGARQIGNRTPFALQGLKRFLHLKGKG
jgi:hypothetical protein